MTTDGEVTLDNKEAGFEMQKIQVQNGVDRTSTQFYVTNNNNKKETLTASIRCSSDFGLSYTTTTKRISAGRKVFMCETNYNYVYIVGDTNSCKWCDKGCNHKVNGKCYYQDLVDNVGGSDRYVADGCPKRCQ